MTDKGRKEGISQFDLKGRFARQYLSFAGKSSKDFLLYLSGPGVYDSPAVDVESTSVPGRNGDIISENARAGRRRYQNVDSIFEVLLVLGRIAVFLAPFGIKLVSGLSTVFLSDAAIRSASFKNKVLSIFFPPDYLFPRVFMFPAVL